MRIVSWNCNGALRKKLDAVRTLNADVYVIQECEDPERCTDKEYQAWAENHHWIGSNKNRGLGVFAKRDIVLAKHHLDQCSFELFLPCIIAGNIALLAVWTRYSLTQRYIGQLWSFLQLHKEFLRCENAICIGDLNSNVCWDYKHQWWSHSHVVEELLDVGCSSIYHHERGEVQGQESTPTFFLHRRLDKPYHIDYAFLSQALLNGSSVEVGQPDNWLEYSDHMPLVVELAHGDWR